MHFWSDLSLDLDPTLDSCNQTNSTSIASSTGSYSAWSCSQARANSPAFEGEPLWEHVHAGTKALASLIAPPPSFLCLAMASDALQNLATSIERLPAAALHSVDGAQLASMLSALASDLPALPQDILEEAMADIDTSASLLTMLPMDELEWTSRESLGELIRFATYRYECAYSLLA